MSICTIHLASARPAPLPPGYIRAGGLISLRSQSTTTAEHSGPRPTPERGVTLIELLVTLSVALILLGVAVPSFQSVIRINRIATLTNELTSSLQLARSEAVTRGTRVTVCKSSDPLSTTPSCETTADWQNGWLIFVDPTNPGTLDSGEILLKVAQPQSNNASITPKNSQTNFEDYVSFISTGSSRGSDDAADPDSLSAGGTLSVCLAPEMRDITLNGVGRLFIAKGTCS